MTTDKLKELNAQLTINIGKILDEVEGSVQVWEPKTKAWMAEVLADSVLRRSVKFYRGQKEHGGDFLTKKFEVVNAIQEESDDSFWYFERFKFDIDKLNKKLNTKL